MKFKRQINKVFIPSNVLGIYQEGGEIVEGPAPVEGGGDPMMELLAVAQQALEAQDCDMSMQVLTMLLEMAQGAGGAPEEGGEAPIEGEAPVAQYGGEADFYKDGGEMEYNMSPQEYAKAYAKYHAKMKKGGKMKDKKKDMKYANGSTFKI